MYWNFIYAYSIGNQVLLPEYDVVLIGDLFRLEIHTLKVMVLALTVHWFP